MPAAAENTTENGGNQRQAGEECSSIVETCIVTFKQTQNMRGQEPGLSMSENATRSSSA
jgi:hypothetical protein